MTRTTFLDICAYTTPHRHIPNVTYMCTTLYDHGLTPLFYAPDPTCRKRRVPGHVALFFILLISFLLYNIWFRRIGVFA